MQVKGFLSALMFAAVVSAAGLYVKAIIWKNEDQESYERFLEMIFPPAPREPVNVAYFAEVAADMAKTQAEKKAKVHVPYRRSPDILKDGTHPAILLADAAGPFMWWEASWAPVCHRPVAGKEWVGDRLLQDGYWSYDRKRTIETWYVYDGDRLLGVLAAKLVEDAHGTTTGVVVVFKSGGTDQWGPAQEELLNWNDAPKAGNN